MKRRHDDLFALIAAAKKNEPGAFDELAERFRPLMVDLVYRYAMNYPDFDRDDAYQEACIALYDALHAYDDGRSGVTFGLYAKICITNRLISICRRLRSRPVETLSDGAESMQDPEEEAMARMRFAELTDMISAALTPLEASVFRLYVQGKSYADIAQTLGVGQKSVDNAVRRMKAKIKGLL